MEKTELEALWPAYKDSGGDLELRNQLVVHYGSLVKYVASRVGAGMPNTVDREDLAAYGLFGLIDAIERFDLAKGVKFETYAITRIRGAIIDELRTLDWVPRSIRAQAKDLNRVTLELENELGRVPEDVELAEAMDMTLAELWIAQSASSTTTVDSMDKHHGEDGDHPSHGDRVYDAAANPEDLFIAGDVGEIIATAIQGMPERFKVILVLYYIEEMTLAEIGEILGVTESRVCQLQGKLLHGMREALGHGRVAA